MIKFGITKVKSLSPSLQKIDLYHYLHQKNKDLVPKIDAVLQEMAENGELESLRAKFAEELYNTSVDKLNVLIP